MACQTQSATRHVFYLFVTTNITTVIFHPYSGDIQPPGSRNLSESSGTSAKVGPDGILKGFDLIYNKSSDLFCHTGKLLISSVRLPWCHWRLCRRICFFEDFLRPSSKRGAQNCFVGDGTVAFLTIYSWCLPFPVILQSWRLLRYNIYSPSFMARARRNCHTKAA